MAKLTLASFVLALFGGCCGRRACLFGSRSSKLPRQAASIRSQETKCRRSRSSANGSAPRAGIRPRWRWWCFRRAALSRSSGASAAAAVGEIVRLGRAVVASKRSTQRKQWTSMPHVPTSIGLVSGAACKRRENKAPDCLFAAGTSQLSGWEKREYERCAHCPSSARANRACFIF